MNIQESINRGFNLLAVSIAGLAGFSFLPEIIFENDIPDKVDDFLLLIFAIIAIVWYNKSNNRYLRSSLPVAIIVIGLVVKIAGLIIEIDDPGAFGDDVGGVILYVISTVLVISQYRKTTRLLAS